LYGKLGYHCIDTGRQATLLIVESDYGFVNRNVTQAPPSLGLYIEFVNPTLSE
jgi:hypothetical protein